MAAEIASEELQAQRRAVCAQCPDRLDMTGNAAYQFLNTAGVPMPEWTASICGKCLCPTAFKIRKTEQVCPAGKWE